MNDTKNTDSSPRKRAYKISVGRLKLTAVLCAVVLCIALFLISPVFKIKTIYVKGNNHVSSEEILQSSGARIGANIFTINASALCKRVEKLSRIGECTIERQLPGRLEIIVEEEAECGYIKLKKGYLGIDENGKVLTKPKVMELSAPLISGIEVSDTEMGEYIKCEEKNAKLKLNSLTTLLGSMEERGLIDDVKAINIKDTKNVTLTLKTDTLVNLGENGKAGKDSFEYKIAFLAAILEKDYPKHGGIIELSDTDNVTSRIS